MDLKALTEHVAERLEMSAGRWRGEFIFQGGELKASYRHEERIPAGAPAHFDHPA